MVQKDSAERQGLIWTDGPFCIDDQAVDQLRNVLGSWEFRGEIITESASTVRAEDSIETMGKKLPGRADGGQENTTGGLEGQFAKSGSFTYRNEGDFSS